MVWGCELVLAWSSPSGTIYNLALVYNYCDGMYKVQRGLDEVLVQKVWSAFGGQL